MNTRLPLTLGLVALTALPLTACADKVDESQATGFTVAADDQTCEVSADTAETGTSTFEVTNNGEKTTEFYVFTEAGRVIGEVENIGPGATRKLVVQINDPGEYVLTCKPGMVGEGISQTLTVTGDALNVTEGDAVLTEAVDGYVAYVRSQTTSLDELTGEFVAAIDEGDLDEAKRLYPLVRTPYERIEPVAEAFPNDLDPRIDLREADLEPGQEWTGFHAIEKQLWEDGAITDETKTLAAQLSDDVAELVDGVNAQDFRDELTPVQIASGAQGLLDEISTSKITGEEDIFSHTDLYDFQANLEGSRAAVASLEKAITDRDPELLGEINQRFDDVQALLDTHREGDGFVSYDTVDEAQRRELSESLDTLTASVVTVQEVITQ